MTSNRRTKKLIRNHMDSTGLCYLEAKRAIEANALMFIDGIPVTAGRGGSGRDIGFLNYSPRLGQVVAVTSAHGGAGKSTLAIGLASYIAKASELSTTEGLRHRNGQPVSRPLKVLVLDLDVRDGQLGTLTGYMKPTVLKLRRFGISEEEIEETRIYDEDLGIDLLLAPRRARSADEVPAEFYERLIEALKPLYDYIILDTSNNYLEPLLEGVAYPLADQILLVTETVSTAIVSMARWIAEVTEPKDYNGMGIPKEKIRIVANKVLRVGALSTIRDQSDGLAPMAKIPAASKSMSKAIDSTNMAMIFEDRKLRSAFANLAESVVGDHYPLGRLSGPEVAME